MYGIHLSRSSRQNDGPLLDAMTATVAEQGRIVEGTAFEASGSDLHKQSLVEHNIPKQNNRALQ